jgi:MOSC domain-containing protein
VRVQELWRYPVKSLQGERLHQALVTAHGLDGDRRYAIFDVGTGLGLTARRMPQLLFASASLTAGGSVRITLPDGSAADGDDALSDWLGRRVALRSAGQASGRRYEDVVDFEREQTSPWRAFEGASGPFHDSGRARVSLVSTQTIGGWDRRRFRPNVLLDGAGEDALTGSSVSLGEAVLDIGGKIQRCVMVTRPQPGGIDRDLDVLRTIARERAVCLAVGALVARAGIVRDGDELRRA